MKLSKLKKLTEFMPVLEKFFQNYNLLNTQQIKTMENIYKFYF